MPCYVQPTKPPSKEEFLEWQKLGYTRTWEDYCSSKQKEVGGVTFLCGNFGDHCADCAAIGEFLCDYPVGSGKTCDRAICDTHGHEIGPNMHYCNTHYEMWKTFKNSGGVSDALRNVIAFKPEK